MGGDVDFHETLLAEIASGKIADKAQLQKRKIQLCRELHFETLPPNSETLARASDELRPLVKEVLRRKPVRTLSGVAVVVSVIGLTFNIVLMVAGGVLILLFSLVGIAYGIAKERSP